MSVISQLQSRIDVRADWIALYEREIGAAKSALKAMRAADYPQDLLDGVAESLDEYRTRVRCMVADQKLDKRVYGELVDEMRARRYFQSVATKLNEQQRKVFNLTPVLGEIEHDGASLQPLVLA